MAHSNSIRGNTRKYSAIADEEAKKSLNELLEASSISDVFLYKSAMEQLGFLLGNSLKSNEGMRDAKNILVASTAEDADYLASGVMRSLRVSHTVKYAIFWNNRYNLSNNDTVAPVVNKHYQEGYDLCDTLVIVKSIMSGSCVVKTNLLSLMSEIPHLLANNVQVVSPVMHKDAQRNLEKVFPVKVSSKFEFTYFAIDNEKKPNGEVVPGIGGYVYPLLGLNGPPAKVGFVPELLLKEYSSVTT